MKITRSYLSAAVLAACAGAAVAQPTIWNFSGSLAADSGPGVMTPRPSQTFLVDTASAFGLPLIGGADSGVLRSDVPVDVPQGGYDVAHGTAANGGGSYGNQYTLIWDVLFPVVNWHSFFNSNEANANDGDFFVRPDGGIGISGVYQGTISANTWHRVAVTINLAGSPTMKKYIDGVLVGTQTLGSGLDGRWALYTTSNAPTDWFILFGDNDGDIVQSYLSSFLFEDRVWTDTEIASIGGATAGGITLPAGSIPPSVTASIAPCAPAGATALITGTPTSGQNPGSTSYTMSADLSSIGLGSNVAMLDDGVAPDAVAGDNVFTGSFVIPVLAAGDYALPVNVTDNLSRTGQGLASLQVFENPPSAGTHETQVDFDAEPAPGDLIPSTFGPGQLEFWDRVVPGSTRTFCAFGSTTSFGIPDIAGTPANVLNIPAFFADEGLRYNNLSPGNGGGTFVNQYTIGVDILWPSQGEVTSGWFPFWNSNNTNSNGGDLWARFSDFSLGWDYNGASAVAPFTAPGVIAFDTWHRIVFSLDTSLCSNRGKIYVNGVKVFDGPVPDSTDTLFSLYSTTDGDPTPDDNEAFSHFGSESTGARTAEAYINSFYFVDRTLSDAEVAAFGAADADGFLAPPVSCEPDVNQDGNVDQDDIACLTQAVAGDPACLGGGIDPDFNRDGNVDQDDISALEQVVAGAPCP
ncbi:MAG: LamG-like jellyroll fold domain-containing protein [Planctomycetota bacterium]|nr:LamG-like jellyroll fold domain-containing protein [Planctomycetota bacterium]